MATKCPQGQLDTEQRELRVDYDSIVTSDDMPHMDRTRADGTPLTLPDGWKATDIVALIVECLNDSIVEVTPQFEPTDGPDDRPCWDATVIADTELTADDRVELVELYKPGMNTERETGEVTTEPFSIEDALGNI